MPRRVYYDLIKAVVSSDIRQLELTYLPVLMIFLMAPSWRDQQVLQFL